MAPAMLKVIEITLTVLMNLLLNCLRSGCSYNPLPVPKVDDGEGKLKIRTEYLTVTDNVTHLIIQTTGFRQWCYQ